MPKMVDYPMAPLKKSYEVAKTVYDLGGSCAIGTCAESVGKKVGGGFKQVVYSAVKYGLLTYKRGTLASTELCKNIVLAYSGEEETGLLATAFLSVSLFQKIYERFKGQKLPVGIFDRFLVKEFGIDQKYASRIAKYFLDGAKSVGLLDSNNLVLPAPGAPVTSETEENVDLMSSRRGMFDERTSPPAVQSQYVRVPEAYTVRISGPEIDSSLSISDEHDLEIVGVILTKIRRKLEQKKEDASEQEKD